MAVLQSYPVCRYIANNIKFYVPFGTKRLIFSQLVKQNSAKTQLKVEWKSNIFGYVFHHFIFPRSFYPIYSC